MARPKNDERGNAQQRMKDALWELVDERGYQRIAARDVIARAHVNKNSFYYHYDNLDALAREALEEMIPRDFMDMLVRRLFCLDVDDAPFLNDAEFKRRMNRLCLAASDQGTPMLQGMLRQAIRDTWIRMLCIDEQSVALDTALAMEFMLGGIMALLAYRARYLLDRPIPDLFDSGFGQTMRASILPAFLVLMRDDMQGPPQHTLLDGA